MMLRWSNTMAKEMMRKPNTMPMMMSLRRATVYPRVVVGSVSSSLVRRMRNLRRINLASIRGFWVDVAVNMVSNADMTLAEAEEEDCCCCCRWATGEGRGRGGAISGELSNSPCSSSSGGSAGASLA